MTTVFDTKNNKVMSAEEALSRYWDVGSLPVDPIIIATKMGISVMADPYLDGSGHYEPNAARNGCPLITYNPKESVVRQRFTIAHELGHHVLNHGPRDRDTPKNFTMAVHDVAEVSANKFAARLLMPADFIHALVQVRGVRNLTRLAKLFSVSGAAMGYRLQELGYAIE